MLGRVTILLLKWLVMRGIVALHTSLSTSMRMAHASFVTLAIIGSRIKALVANASMRGMGMTPPRPRRLRSPPASRMAILVPFASRPRAVAFGSITHPMALSSIAVRGHGAITWPRPRMRPPPLPRRRAPFLCFLLLLPRPVLLRRPLSPTSSSKKTALLLVGRRCLASCPLQASRP